MFTEHELAQRKVRWQVIKCVNQTCGIPVLKSDGRYTQKFSARMKKDWGLEIHGEWVFCNWQSWGHSGKIGIYKIHRSDTAKINTLIMTDIRILNFHEVNQDQIFAIANRFIHENQDILPNVLNQIVSSYEGAL